jgi:hypothetical protein
MIPGLPLAFDSDAREIERLRRENALLREELDSIKRRCPICGGSGQAREGYDHGHL